MLPGAVDVYAHLEPGKGIADGALDARYSVRPGQNAFYRDRVILKVHDKRGCIAGHPEPVDSAYPGTVVLHLAGRWLRVGNPGPENNASAAGKIMSVARQTSNGKVRVHGVGSTGDGYPGLRARLFESMDTACNLHADLKTGAGGVPRHATGETVVRRNESERNRCRSGPPAGMQRKQHLVADVDNRWCCSQCETRWRDWRAKTLREYAAGERRQKSREDEEKGTNVASGDQGFASR